MDKGEVDELIRKAKATAKRQQAEHDRHEEYEYPNRTNEDTGNDTDRSGGRPGTPPSPAARSKVNTHEERENRSEQMRRISARGDGKKGQPSSAVGSLICSRMHQH